MKASRIIYYFLFLAIVVGGFASMAKNDYGLTLISFACFMFSLRFIYELFLSRSTNNRILVLELLGLAAFFILFGLRAAYIHFPYAEWYVVIVSVFLVGIYFVIGNKNLKEVKASNKQVYLYVAAYYSGLILFTLSISLRPITVLLSEIFGYTGGVLLGIFILGLWRTRNQLVDGVETNAYQYVRNQFDHSTLLMTCYLMISFYIGLSRLNILPPLYTNEVPRAYLELVNEAETGREQPVDGEFKHDKFKKAYDEFVTNNDLN